MSDGVKRTVRLGSMAYINPDGQVRWADCGAEILIHPDHVAGFDRLNVLAGEPAPVVEPADPPKRRPGRPRKDATED